MHNIEITFYKNRNNKCPVREFLDALDWKEAKKITRVLKAIKEIENLPKLYFKKLRGTDDIWECRIKCNKKFIRILCFFTSNSNLILTHGFFKKDNKVSINEIKKAEIYKKEYLERIKNG